MAKPKHNGHLQLDPKNARRHSPRNQALIRQSLETVGAGRSILADANGIVRAGNGVFEQWGDRPVKIVETDGKQLVVVKRTDLRGKAAVRAAMLDNLAADSSYADYDAEILAEIARDDELIKQLAEEDYRLRLLLNGPDNPTDPNKEWQGMPEFDQKDLSAFKSIVVHFDSPLSMQKFAKLIGQPITEKTRFVWYPKAKIDRYADKRYVDES